MNTNRQRGITMQLLAVDTIETAALTKRPLDEGERWDVGWTPWAVAYSKGGVLYAVNNEGVGQHVTDTNPLRFDLYKKSETSFSMMPGAAAHLGPDEVLALRTGETIDLADLIRTFGGRLEDNFWLWHRILSGGESDD